jgi:hypothetical protein
MRNFRYPDTRLREQIDQWVLVPSATLQPPTGVTMLGPHLAGFIYVDPASGFVFRAGCFVQRVGGELAAGPELARWDNPLERQIQGGLVESAHHRACLLIRPLEPQVITDC